MPTSPQEQLEKYFTPGTWIEISGQGHGTNHFIIDQVTAWELKDPPATKLVIHMHDQHNDAIATWNLSDAWMMKVKASGQVELPPLSTLDVLPAAIVTSGGPIPTQRAVKEYVTNQGITGAVMPFTAKNVVVSGNHQVENKNDRIITLPPARTAMNPDEEIIATTENDTHVWQVVELLYGEGRLLRTRKNDFNDHTKYWDEGWDYPTVQDALNALPLCGTTGDAPAGWRYHRPSGRTPEESALRQPDEGGVIPSDDYYRAVANAGTAAKAVGDQMAKLTGAAKSVAAANNLSMEEVKKMMKQLTEQSSGLRASAVTQGDDVTIGWGVNEPNEPNDPLPF